MGTSKRIHQMTFGQWEKAFPDEEACKGYLAKHRWPEGVSCPRCGAAEVYELTRAFHWQCKECSTHGYRFSVLVGTIFQNTNKPLRDWFRVIHIMLTSKKGVSSHQIYRTMGFGSYETALYMTHRVRAAMADAKFRKLIGYVEVDETYVGGSNRNRHWDKKTPGTGAAEKFIVIGAAQRKGNVVARVIENTQTETFESFVREVVSNKCSLLSTDEHSAYRKLSPDYPHRAVRHHAKNYVVGAIHTNTIEGFWSIFKRGIMGTFHKVSRKYLPLYVAEFSWRYNNRLNSNIFRDAVKAC